MSSTGYVSEQSLFVDERGSMAPSGPGTPVALRTARAEVALTATHSAVVAVTTVDPASLVAEVAYSRLFTLSVVPEYHSASVKDEPVGVATWSSGPWQSGRTESREAFRLAEVFVQTDVLPIPSISPKPALDREAYERADELARVVECRILAASLWGADVLVFHYPTGDSSVPLPGHTQNGVDLVLLDYSLQRLHWSIQVSQDGQQVTATKGNHTVVFTVGQDTAVVDGQSQSLGGTVAMDQDHRVVPLAGLAVLP